jgi:hypothetical protein
VTCAICQELIRFEPPAGTLDKEQLQHAFEQAAQAHLRTHPAVVQARFWLRRFLDDVAPAERAAAVREIYTELRRLWGATDSVGVYTVADALGAVEVYRLWLAADRCSDDGCRHEEQAGMGDQGSTDAGPGSTPEPPGSAAGLGSTTARPGSAPARSRSATSRLGRALSAATSGRMRRPASWRGTAGEWRALQAAAANHCTCAPGCPPAKACSAHRLVVEELPRQRLLFIRRLADELKRQEHGQD